jgi:predicted AAA+ superfamily ATPase
LIKSPKLYFFDVDLAAYLLGIQTAAQMSRDPLRGNLFENLVVIDALKYQYNRGERSSLHYYRDSRGHEVDLLVDAAGRLCPIEINQGQRL